MPYFYLVSGLTLASDVQFTTLAPTGVPSTVDLEFIIAEAPPPEPSHWFLERSLPSGRAPFMSTARIGTDYLVRVAGRASFLVSHDGSRIVAHASDGLECDAIEQLLLDVIVPQALQLRGECALHASAVALGDRASAFLGSSGAGKSTLAAALVPPGLLISDDCLALRRSANGLVALPSYASVRLREDSVGQYGSPAALRPASSRMIWKRRLPLQLAQREVPLARVYVLGEGERVRIEELGPFEATEELARQVHRLDPENRTALRAEFEIVTALVATVPVRRLLYPREFTQLTHVVRAITDDQGSG